jgi:hypothetical protein
LDHICDGRDVFDDPDEEDAFEFGYDTAMDFWYDEEDFECRHMYYFVKEVEDEICNECEDEEEDLIDSCEKEVHEAIEEMEDYCG